MKFTAAGRYALRALVHLAAAQEERFVASSVVAQACGIPGAYMLKVLRPLASARILDALKGPNGGFRLTRPAKEITLLEIVEAVDGPLRGLVPTVETAEGAQLDRQLAAICDQAADMTRRQLAR